MLRVRKVSLILLILSLLSVVPKSYAEESIHIAVASNFYASLKQIANEFTVQTGIKVHLSNGASGMLYSKIKRGAPYDLFFSADSRRPILLEKSGLIEPASRFTYVMGRLVVWSPNELLLSADLSVLNPNNKNLRFVAIANPKTAPYGVAALSVLKHYGLYQDLAEQNKIALGESVGKAYQYTATMNAQLGLISKSYVSNPLQPVQGRVFEIPQHLYKPLAQQAVTLKGRASASVQAFIEFFNSDKIQADIQTYGYGIATGAIPAIREEK